MNNKIDASQQSKIHLLDVGAKEYGDSVLCQFGRRTVLIDGSHPGDENGTPGHKSIPAQIGELVGAALPVPIDLLIITHAHQDHIGCLPRLIADGVLKVKWALVIDPALGWGRGGGEDRDALAEDEKVLALAAALREEVRTKKGTNESDLQDFLTDSGTLENRYIKMLGDLKQQGTSVVQYGRDSAQLLLAEFSDIKLKILGPSTEHLLLCAEIINIKTRDSIKRATDVFTRDAGIDSVAAYRELVGAGSPEVDALDAQQRPGPAINLQSIVTQFEYGKHKFLFAGDFQFAKTEVNSPQIETSVRRLRKAISREAPYSFVKLSHHGSYNGFSEEVYEELGGTQFFGLCAGEESTHHPNRQVLELLDEHRNDISWARTDHNGLVTLTFQENSNKPQINLSQGILNDAVPNDSDTTTEKTKPKSATAEISETNVVSQSSVLRKEQQLTGSISGSSSEEISVKTGESHTVKSGEQSAAEFIELSAKIPHTGTRIRFSGEFSIEVEPSLQISPAHTSSKSSTTPPGPANPQSDATITIGGGRTSMKNLLFVTCREVLAANIGKAETEQIIAALDQQKIPYYADLPSQAIGSAQAAAEVRRELGKRPNIKGVIIIGGYDVVPSQILDCLPKPLRQSLNSNDDPDNFIVWNDEVYGDRDGDGLPEIPVSRIPDGKSSLLVFTALQVSYSEPGTRRFGIRNIARPFAKTVFQTIPGNEQLSISRDTVFNQTVPPLSVQAEQVYFMLHGDYTDGSRFWGEGTPQNREAFNVGNLPNKFKGVIFTGCCWGALTVNTPAGLTQLNRPFGQKTTESSIALSFLARGATAFIGCTGAHYSPTEEPYNYFGGPMHLAFWRYYNTGLAPAEALFRAKVEYVREMPHGRTSPIQTAIEYKILRQYTCLGLGW